MAAGTAEVAQSNSRRQRACWEIRAETPKPNAGLWLGPTGTLSLSEVEVLFPCMDACCWKSRQWLLGSFLVLSQLFPRSVISRQRTTECAFVTQIWAVFICHCFVPKIFSSDPGYVKLVLQTEHLMIINHKEKTENNSLRMKTNLHANEIDVLVWLTQCRPANFLVKLFVFKNVTPVFLEWDAG